MKKIISIVLIFLSVSCVFASNYNPKRPEWKDFCPFGMENAQPTEYKWYMSYYRKLKLNDQNYWYQRREDFEKDLASCDELQNNKKEACYEKLVNRQKHINESYVSPRERYMERMQQMQQMSTASGANYSQAYYQQQQLDLQRQQMLMQNAPKWDANAYMPKTYNVNLNHNVRYKGF